MTEKQPLITTTQELNDCLAQLKNAPYVAVDTEFQRETTYWAKLCLIQLATPQGAWAIDTLSPDLDLSAFWTFLKDSNICKIFHSAHQDLEIFWEQGDTLPQNFFDTQIAVLALGYPDSMGYQALVETFVGKHLSKNAQVTDWTRRPLSDEQLTYALNDVRYLIQVYEKLLTFLKDQNRTDWPQQPMDDLLDPKLYKPTPLMALQRAKPKSYAPSYLKSFVALAWCREELALQHDVPRRKIASDDLLREWVAAHPGSGAEVYALRAMKRGRPHKDFMAMAFKALDAPCPLSDDQFPQEPRSLSRRQQAQLDALKFLLKMQAAAMDVNSLLIARQEDLAAIAHDNTLPLSLKTGWRWDAFGQFVSQFLEGKIGICFKKNKLQVVDVS